MAIDQFKPHSAGKPIRLKSPGEGNRVKTPLREGDALGGDSLPPLRGPSPQIRAGSPQVFFNPPPRSPTVRDQPLSPAYQRTSISSPPPSRGASPHHPSLVPQQEARSPPPPSPDAFRVPSSGLPTRLGPYTARLPARSLIHGASATLRASPNFQKGGRGGGAGNKTMSMNASGRKRALPSLQYNQVGASSRGGAYGSSGVEMLLVPAIDSSISGMKIHRPAPGKH